jgi:hypothetical protein
MNPSTMQNINMPNDRSPKKHISNISPAGISYAATSMPYPRDTNSSQSQTHRNYQENAYNQTQ